ALAPLTSHPLFDGLPDEIVHGMGCIKAGLRSRKADVQSRQGVLVSRGRLVAEAIPQCLAVHGLEEATQHRPDEMATGGRCARPFGAGTVRAGSSRTRADGNENTKWGLPGPHVLQFLATKRYWVVVPQAPVPTGAQRGQHQRAKKPKACQPGDP
ncbi:hypothetical protein AtubIFM54640_002952, partial [Aspergillus tubingensis]